MKNIFRILLLLSFLNIVSVSVFSQESNKSEIIDLRKNSINFAFGGSGQFLSLNYARTFIEKPNYFINASIGIGATLFIESHGFQNTEDDGGSAFFHQIAINFGKKTSFLEIGLGGVYWKEYVKNKNINSPRNTYFLVPSLGLKKYFFKRIVLKVYVTPIVMISEGNYNPKEFYSSYIGISLGYSF